MSFRVKRGFIVDQRDDNGNSTPFFLQTRESEILPENGVMTNNPNYLDFKYNVKSDYDIRINTITNQMGFSETEITIPLSQFSFTPYDVIENWNDGNTWRGITDTKDLKVMELVKRFAARGYFKHGAGEPDPHTTAYSDIFCRFPIDMTYAEEIAPAGEYPVYLYRPPVSTNDSNTGQSRYNQAEVGWYSYVNGVFTRLYDPIDTILFMNINLPSDVVKLGSIMYSEASIYGWRNEQEEDIFRSTSLVTSLGSSDYLGVTSNWDNNTITNVCCRIAQRDTEKYEYGMAPDGVPEFNNAAEYLYVKIKIHSCNNESIHLNTDVRPIE